MKRRHRRRAVLAWLSGLLTLAAPIPRAIAREVETDGMTSGSGGVGPVSIPSDGLGWWWVAIVAGIIVVGALIVTVADTMRRRPPRLPRAHPA